MASDAPIDTRPDPAAIDEVLANETKGGFRYLDGRTLLGLLQTLAYVRRAIADETEVYTLDRPPKFFGEGISGN
jgi:spermidine synthase